MAKWTSIDDSEKRFRSDQADTTHRRVKQRLAVDYPNGRTCSGCGRTNDCGCPGTAWSGRS